VAVFLGALVLGLLLGLGVRPLELEEPRRALVALEMNLRGDLVVPTTNGALYLNKPPLFSWLLLGLMRLTGGAGEAWLRLPTVLSFLLAGAAVALAARPLGRTPALLAPVLFFTFGDLLFYGTLHADIDLFFTLLVTLQALAIYGFEQRGRPLALFTVSYLLAAIAFLTKSYPALAFQALTLLAWLVAARRARWLSSWQHLAGLAVFLALAGGYFLLYAQRADAGRYLLRLLLDSSERTVVASHGAGALLVQLVAFPLTLAKACLPWSLFAGLLFLPAFRARVRAEPLLKFAAIFVAVNAVPYWLSPGTRPRYLFPLLPFVALLLAAALPHLADRGGYARAARWALGAALTLGAAAPLALPFVPDLWRLVDHRWAWFLVAAALAGAAVAFWRAPALPGRVLALALALALARVAYDLVVPALRRERSEATFLRAVADELNRDHRGARIFLAGVERAEERRIPLLGGTAAFPLPEWFPMSLSFYYSAGRGEVLPYATSPRPGDLLLAHPRFDLGRPHDVVKTWEGARHEDLKLVRVRE
jgi:4-amino-4-deoxy-L-arabinose transferase-like glycosyltransferase